MPLTVKEPCARLDSEGASPGVYSIGEPLDLESYCIVETYPTTGYEPTAADRSG
jgi:hypothetical protein